MTVKFTSKNTAAAPTLNVNGTGAKPIKDYAGNDLTQAAREWPEGAAMALTYDGSSWRVQDSNLMERVHSAETSIEQNAKDIKLKANTNDVYNKDGVDDLIAQEILDRNAAIELSATGIKQIVSETYATKSEAKQTDSDFGKREIVTEDAAELPLLTLTAYGECQQDGTPTPDAPVPIKAVQGRNLANPEQFIKAYVNNGKVTALSNQVLVYFKCEPSTTYYISENILTTSDRFGYGYTAEVPTAGVTAYSWTSVKGSNGDAYVGQRVSRILTTGADAKYVIVWAGTDDTFTTESELQVEKGHVTGYTPYDCVAVKTVGKNVLELPPWSVIAGCPRSASYYNYQLPLKPNVTYHLNTQWDDVSLAKQCGYILVANDVGNTNWKSIAHTSSGYSNANIDSGTSGVLYLNVNATQAQYETMLAHAKPQLELGTKATEYEPYRESVSYIDLKGHDLHGLNETYRDELEIDASRHAVIHKRTKRVVLDGSESWTHYTYTAGHGYFARFNSLDLPQPSGRYGNSIVASSVATHGDSVHAPNNSVYFAGSDTVADFDFIVNDYATVDAWKAYLAESPAEMVYALKESDWYDIDLGYIDLPTAFADGTLHVSAEIQPIIDASW